MTKLTAHSEYGMIHSLLIKSATQAFRSEEYLMSQWRQLNYLALPDFKKSLQEYEEFVQLLQMSCSMYTKCLLVMMSRSIAFIVEMPPFQQMGA
jgi:hypothetical protein